VGFIEAVIGTDIALLFQVMSIISLILLVIVVCCLLLTNKNFKGYPYAEVAELDGRR
jgi:hypothetical protein